MAWWKKTLERFQDDGENVDYYDEAVSLLQSGAYHEALTSLRLALRERPKDITIRQQIAIAYTRIGMTDEAMRTYRAVLEDQPDAVGAHYGLAFLLLRDGEREEAVRHLRAFLDAVPDGAAIRRHVEHARKTLAELTRDSVRGDAPHG